MECNNAIAYISFKITIQVVYLDRTGTRKTSPNYISTVWKGSTNVCHESSPPESNPQISKHTLHTKHTHRLKRDNPKFTWLLWLAQGPGFLNDMLNTPSKVHVASFGLATYRLKKKKLPKPPLILSAQHTYSTSIQWWKTSIQWWKRDRIRAIGTSTEWQWEIHSGSLSLAALISCWEGPLVRRQEKFLDWTLLCSLGRAPCSLLSVVPGSASWDIIPCLLFPCPHLKWALGIMPSSVTQYPHAICQWCKFGGPKPLLRLEQSETCISGSIIPLKT